MVSTSGSGQGQGIDRPDVRGEVDDNAGVGGVRRVERVGALGVEDGIVRGRHPARRGQRRDEVHLCWVVQFGATVRQPLAAFAVSSAIAIVDFAKIASGLLTFASRQAEDLASTAAQSLLFCMLISVFGFGWFKH